MKKSLTDGFDRFHLVPNGSPTMTAQHRDRPFARRWIRKVIPASVVVLIVGSLGTILYRAVEKARNAAMSASTT